MHRNDRPAVVVTCEHATCFVPKPFRVIFAGHDHILHSHRGWDPGTLDLGKSISKHLSFPLFATKVSRLLVEVNRSVWHRQLFSEFSSTLNQETKACLLDKYYFSHRNSVESWIASQALSGLRVLHLSLHSFTPHFDGVTRNADIGLLYDPRRMGEREFCQSWKLSFRQLIPDWRVRMNYPYSGSSDGFTTYLRKRFSDAQYAGIELEINQKWVLDHPKLYKRRMQDLVKTIAHAVL